MRLLELYILFFKQKTAYELRIGDCSSDVCASDLLTFKLFTGGALLGAKATLDGVRDGVADVGHVAYTYFPASFPRAQLLNELSMVGTNNNAASFADRKSVVEGKSASRRVDPGVTRLMNKTEQTKNNK